MARSFLSEGMHDAGSPLVSSQPSPLPQSFSSPSAVVMAAIPRPFPEEMSPGRRKRGGPVDLSQPFVRQLRELEEGKGKPTAPRELPRTGFAAGLICFFGKDRSFNFGRRKAWFSFSTRKMEGQVALGEPEDLAQGPKRGAMGGENVAGDIQEGEKKGQVLVEGTEVFVSACPPERMEFLRAALRRLLGSAVASVYVSDGVLMEADPLGSEADTTRLREWFVSFQTGLVRGAESGLSGIAPLFSSGDFSGSSPGLGCIQSHLLEDALLLRVTPDGFVSSWQALVGNG